MSNLVVRIVTGRLGNVNTVHCCMYHYNLRKKELPADFWSSLSFLYVYFFSWMPKQKTARGRPKKNRMEGIRKAMSESNLNEGQWEDRKQWSLGVGQRRKTFWNRYIYIYIHSPDDSVCVYIHTHTHCHRASVYRRGAFKLRVKQYKSAGNEWVFSKPAVTTPSLSRLKDCTVLIINYKWKHMVCIV